MVADFLSPNFGCLVDDDGYVIHYESVGSKLTIFDSDARVLFRCRRTRDGYSRNCLKVYHWEHHFGIPIGTLYF
jgi:hypothetical protein